jgi:hypothetical protein
MPRGGGPEFNPAELLARWAENSTPLGDGGRVTVMTEERKKRVEAELKARIREDRDKAITLLFETAEAFDPSTDERLVSAKAILQELIGLEADTTLYVKRHSHLADTVELGLVGTSASAFLTPKGNDLDFRISNVGGESHTDLGEFFRFNRETQRLESAEPGPDGRHEDGLLVLVRHLVKALGG